ncbi:MAG: hypothetical protein UZ22_OP11002000298 [Microgenomates bacterium OLB23]|nr:MAG: hypothetical protein UZ22_OP11002000298 [Microgenomates bacterium OLB23]
MQKIQSFTFEGSSDTTYFAKANSALSGGTEEEVQTASKEDFKRIEAEIQEQINKKKSEALAAGDNSYKVLNELTEIELTKEDYSKEVAEEAKTLDAKVTAEVTFYLYNDAVVKSALIKDLAEKVPDQYELKPEHVSFTIANSEITDDGVSISLNAKGKPSYKVDQKELVARIKAKPTKSVEQIIKSNARTSGYSLEVNSPIPFFKFFTPLFDRNYTVTSEPLE